MTSNAASHPTNPYLELLQEDARNAHQTRAASAHPDPNPGAAQPEQPLSAGQVALALLPALVVLLALVRMWRSVSVRARLRQRSTRISIAGFGAWTGWVVFRTADHHELLGVYLDRWDDRSFYINWLLPPITWVVCLTVWQWVKRGE